MFNNSINSSYKSHLATDVVPFYDRDVSRLKTPVHVFSPSPSPRSLPGSGTQLPPGPSAGGAGVGVRGDRRRHLRGALPPLPAAGRAPRVPAAAGRAHGETH